MSRVRQAEARDTQGPWYLAPPLVAAAVALLVYLPSIAGGFFYDDGGAVVMNPSIRDLTALGAILRYEPARPLLNLTWALNYAIGGLAAWQYHLFNVLIHAGNAALLASLFGWMARRRNWPEPRAAALLGACFFAASPMAAETVAYVASRSSALVTLFSLASLRIAVGVMSGGPRLRLVFSLSLFFLALATKEEAVAVPLLLLLLDYFFFAGQRLSELRRRAWLHLCFLIVLPLGLLARRLVTGAWLPAPAIPRGLYLLTQWAAFPQYFLRALIPVDPAFYRHHAPASWPPDALTVGWSLLTVVLVLLAWRRRHDWPEWSFAVACLAVGLLPSSSLVPLVEMVVDHRAYLGSFGVAFALGGLLWRLGRARPGILIMLVLAAISLRYEWILADPVRAWEDALRRDPRSGDALCALGESYAAHQDPRAEQVFQRVARLYPDNYRYWANLGVYYSERERLQEAEAALRTAANRAPRDGAVHDYLGQVLLRLGRPDQAAAEFEAAIAGEPTFGQAYVNLAALSLTRGQPDRARALLAVASRVANDPDVAARIANLNARLP